MRLGSLRLDAETFANENDDTIKIGCDGATDRVGYFADSDESGISFLVFLELPLEVNHEVMKVRCGEFRWSIAGQDRDQRHDLGADPRLSIVFQAKGDLAGCLVMLVHEHSPFEQQLLHGQKGSVDIVEVGVLEA